MTLKEKIQNYSNLLTIYHSLFEKSCKEPTDKNVKAVKEHIDLTLAELSHIDLSQIDRIMGFTETEYTRFEFYGGRGLVLEFRPKGTTNTYIADLNAVTLK